MSEPTGIIAYSTSNYEAMRDFFSAVGFSVSEEQNQLLPLFEKKRGSYVERGDIAFNLEESSDRAKRASVSMLLFGYSDAEVRAAIAKTKHHTKEAGFSGVCYSFPSPDGGVISLSV